MGANVLVKQPHQQKIVTFRTNEHLNAPSAINSMMKNLELYQKHSESFIDNASKFGFPKFLGSHRPNFPLKHAEENAFVSSVVFQNIKH